MKRIIFESIVITLLGLIMIWGFSKLADKATAQTYPPNSYQYLGVEVHDSSGLSILIDFLNKNQGFEIYNVTGEMYIIRNEHNQPSQSPTYQYIGVNVHDETGLGKVIGLLNQGYELYNATGAMYVIRKAH